jgi:L-ascorbate metabolism protein UlaG (beta-lactamase superfamily)
MHITKLGHCCMLIEVNGKKIMTDPGGWSDFKQNVITDVDIILITHEHGDHLHTESLHRVLKNNPEAIVVTNTSVGKILKNEQISFEKLEDTENNTVAGIYLEGHGKMHKEIYGDMGMVQNTGYFIENTFFYPGDALTDPKKQVEALALPVVGPWLNIKDTINYAKALKPKIAFPVHDGMLKITGPFHALPKNLLTPEGIDVRLPEGEEDLVVTL